MVNFDGIEQKGRSRELLMGAILPSISLLAALRPEAYIWGASVWWQRRGRPRMWMRLLAREGNWTSDFNLAPDLRCRPFLPCVSVSSLLTRKMVTTFPKKDVCSNKTFWKYKTFKRKSCHSQSLCTLTTLCYACEDNDNIPFFLNTYNLTSD